MDLNGIKALPTGNIIDFHNPSSYRYEVPEIASLLSKLKRFNGFGVDVATHSLYVADVLYKLTENPCIALLGLLHDAHEAYTGDVTTPVKHILGKKLDDLERMVQRAILWQLDAKHEDGLGAERLIKLIDLFAMKEEVTAMVTTGRYKLDTQGVWEEALRPVANLDLGNVPRFYLQLADEADFINRYDDLSEQAKIVGRHYEVVEFSILGELCKFKVSPNAPIKYLLNGE